MSDVDRLLSEYIAQHRAMFGQLPVLSNLVQGLGDRVNSVEAKLSVQAADGTGLTNRFAKLEESLSSNFRTARNQAQAVATQVGERVKAELNKSLVAIQSRLTGVEDTQRESIQHVAQLEGELASLRREMADMREQTATQLSAAQQLRAAQQVTTVEVSELKGRLASNTDKISNVADHLSRQRTDFVVSKNRTEQVVPGLYLTIRQTDPGLQSVDGWLQLANEGRILRIHAQGAQKPIIFVTQQEQRTHELVFTRIGKDSVIGYLLMPPPTAVANALVTRQ